MNHLIFSISFHHPSRSNQDSELLALASVISISEIMIRRRLVILTVVLSNCSVVDRVIRVVKRSRAVVVWEQTHRTENFPWSVLWRTQAVHFAQALALLGSTEHLPSPSFQPIPTFTGHQSFTNIVSTTENSTCLQNHLRHHFPHDPHQALNLHLHPRTGTSPPQI
ncbi:hypothetical protein BJ508DRAFT_1061 [Ascobolus immersus RN42]|uniref:Uncharacterized protein n=1 Tax=Ascobolus immersus RN42 TaxID=1160509 RepID=A0A3N4IP74_ASCIM|nr:hypothetical protein BJ508DRAFT_1061 [Ascobolus immersus RN42]